MEQKIRENSITEGVIWKQLLVFFFPILIGTFFQQLYNTVDTIIVGQYVGKEALAAVGTTGTLINLLVGFFVGVSSGATVIISQFFGGGDWKNLSKAVHTSIALALAGGGMILVLGILTARPSLALLGVPEEILEDALLYLNVYYSGILFCMIYNVGTGVLRAIGDSRMPLYVLIVCCLVNIVLDLLFVVVFHWGVAGAAAATVLSQYLSGLGLLLYSWIFFPACRMLPGRVKFQKRVFGEIGQFSVLTCLQQSVMNLGILMVQGLVNSFGTAVMAAFAAAVKIDSFAYMPVQDFGNAFSTFTAQNYGAGKKDRIRAGTRSAVICSVLFCLAVSLGVCVFARPLLLLFIRPQETEILAIGVRYLRIEGACYCGIGCLFLLYGFYRAVGRPGMSLVLTVISLGTRVALAYTLSGIPSVGVEGIWWSVPIGWFLADAAGFLYYRIRKPV